MLAAVMSILHLSFILWFEFLTALVPLVSFLHNQIADCIAIVVTVGPKDTPMDVVLEMTYDAKAGIGMPEL